jgi:predicted RNA binding protein YcfA (HicA-like mRNA interferase family)
MPRRLFNWKFADVDRFLRERGFRIDHTHTDGSHYYYHGSNGGILRIVHVPFHGSKSIKPKTMNSIIVQSGISRKEWLG